ncbi:MAG: hypothetical protein ANABAC_1417 [Anaerolineae bacterium]|nr:MAG: hypothetical protein ANABAC_1417 [Anaerolineae bacterium]
MHAQGIFTAAWIGNSACEVVCVERPKTLDQPERIVISRTERSS